AGSTNWPVGSETTAVTVTRVFRIARSSSLTSLSLTVQNSIRVKPAAAATWTRSENGRPPSAKSHSMQGDRTRLRPPSSSASRVVCENALDQAVRAMVDRRISLSSSADGKFVREERRQVQLSQQLGYELLT